MYGILKEQSFQATSPTVFLESLLQLCVKLAQVAFDLLDMTCEHFLFRLLVSTCSPSFS